MKFYFVCTGNTCRSPIAERLFNEKFKNMRELFYAESFGLFPDSSSANKNSIKVMEEWGYDLIGFTPSSLEIKNPDITDIILTMTTDQRNYLREMEFQNVFTLKEFVGKDDFDIQDPYGQNIDVYRNVRDELHSLMETLYYKLGDYETK